MPIRFGSIPHSRLLLRTRLSARWASRSGPGFSPGLNLDFYALALIFLGISTTAGAINFIVSILKLRAPGMSINRMPLFIWNILVTAFAVVFAIPPLTVANVLVELDRKAGTHFYDPAGGGSRTARRSSIRRRA